MELKMKQIEIKGLNEIIYYDKASCGLPIYMWQNKNRTQYYLSLGVKYGSNDTDYKIGGKTYHDPKGIAHYLEHLKFNESDNFSANDFFEANGSSSNAFTTYDYTNYEVIGTECFSENLNHLLDFVFTPFFKTKLINKERGIITEEIKMGLDNPYNKLYYDFYKSVFKNYNYGYEIAGTVDDIKKIDLKSIKRVYNTFYVPDNMFLIITGNFNPYEAVEIVNKNLKNKKFLPTEEAKKIIKKEPNKVVLKEKTIKGNVEIPKVKLGIKIPKNRFKNIDNEVILICISMILKSNFGATSSFQEFLLQNRLVEFINFSREIYNDYILITFTFESRIPEEAIKLIIDKLNNLEVDKDSIERRRNVNVANIILDYDNIMCVNSNIQTSIVKDGKITDNLKEIFENISLENVQDIKDKLTFNIDQIAVVKLIPKTD